MCTGFVETKRGRKGMDSLTIISGNFPCIISWWRHPMETFSAFLAIYAGNSPVTGEFPAQKPVTRNFWFYDLRLDERLSKQSWSWWFETPWPPLWRHSNEIPKSVSYVYRLWYQPSSSLISHTAPKSGFIRSSFSNVYAMNWNVCRTLYDRVDNLHFLPWWLVRVTRTKLYLVSSCKN